LLAKKGRSRGDGTSFPKRHIQHEHGRQCVEAQSPTDRSVREATPPNHVCMMRRAFRLTRSMCALRTERLDSGLSMASGVSKTRISNNPTLTSRAKSFADYSVLQLIGCHKGISSRPNEAVIRWCDAGTAGRLSKGPGLAQDSVAQVPVQRFLGSNVNLHPQ
jgi:hypothetical protein